MVVDDETKYSILTTILIIQDALGGGVELLGGLWVFCIGLIGLKSTLLNKYFNLFSLVLGTIGIITTFPFFYGLVGVFGIFQIVWFVWLAILLRRLS